MDVSACIAVMLVRWTRAKGGQVGGAEHVVRTELSGVSYVILAAVFLIIVGGLGWCFYKALSAAGGQDVEQRPDEIGDEAAKG
jgi:hypothetical protein